MPDSFFEEPQASVLEAIREEKRKKKGRITFDCFNAIYPSKGSRVKCKLGLQMTTTGAKGTMELAAVLAGRTGYLCRRCSHFEGD